MIQDLAHGFQKVSWHEEIHACCNSGVQHLPQLHHASSIGKDISRCSPYQKQYGKYADLPVSVTGAKSYRVKPLGARISRLSHTHYVIRWVADFPTHVPAILASGTVGSQFRWFELELSHLAISIPGRAGHENSREQQSLFYRGFETAPAGTGSCQVHIMTSGGLQYTSG